MLQVSLGGDIIERPLCRTLKKVTVYKPEPKQGFILRYLVLTYSNLRDIRPWKHSRGN